MEQGQDDFLWRVLEKSITVSIHVWCNEDVEGYNSPCLLDSRYGLCRLVEVCLSVDVEREIIILFAVDILEDANAVSVEISVYVLV